MILSSILMGVKSNASYLDFFFVIQFITAIGNVRLKNIYHVLFEFKHTEIFTSYGGYLAKHDT